MKLFLSAAGCLLALMLFPLLSDAQTIAITSFSSNPICAGATITINYTRSSMPNASTETAELSDASGSFTAPVSLGTNSAAAASTSGTITGTIPSASVTGTGYLIRLSSDYVPVATAVTQSLTISATVGTPTFALGATSSICQGSPNVTYTASATDNTGITYTLATSPADPSTTINASIGEVTYDAGFSGTATITASAAGCNGPVTANHVVTVTPSVGTPVFASGLSSGRCIGAGTVSYVATAANNTGITYSLLKVPPDPTTTINSSTGDVTYSAAFFGTATITASATGCNGPTSASHIVTVTPSIGSPIFTSGSTSTRCQGAGTANYGATSTGSLSVSYSLVTAPSDPTTTINSTTGIVTYSAGFSGTATITASATGCGGPISSMHVATVTPTVSTPVFTGGANSTRCQGAATVSYPANAANSSSVTYSLVTAPLDPSTTINASNGDVTFSAGFSGMATITASAAGCNGPKMANHVVTVTATVGTPTFAMGSSSTRCQGAGTTVYTANATSSTAITYSLVTTPSDPTTTIVSSTGSVTFSAGFSGTATITASAAGCNGPKMASHVVTVTATVGTPVFTLGSTSTRCQSAGNVGYSATATTNTGIIYTLDATTTAAGNSIIASTGVVTYVAGWAGYSTITATASGCNGPKTATHIVNTLGIPVFSPASSNRCQGFSILTYTATAINSTGITYSLSPAGASGINSSTGAVSYDPAFSGTVIITASTAGCSSMTPLTGTHTVTVVAGVGPASFVGASPTACQGSMVTYTAAASGNTGITYSISTNPGVGASINSTTGVVSYNSTFTGSAIITATATGCGPSTVAMQSVVITPVVTQPVFNAGPSSTICQGLTSPVTSITYTATAANTILPLVYGVSPVNAGTINTATGQLTYSPTFTGAATISVVATGCDGTLTSYFPVNVTPSVGVPAFTLGTSSTRKQGSGNTTYGGNGNQRNDLVLAFTSVCR